MPHSTKPLNQRAKDIRDGIIGALDSVFLFSAFCFFIITIVPASPVFKDATDVPGWFTSRSGMGLSIDHETGCQYLTHYGITPRLNAQGHQICFKQIDR